MQEETNNLENRILPANNEDENVDKQTLLFSNEADHEENQILPSNNDFDLQNNILPLNNGTCLQSIQKEMRSMKLQNLELLISDKPEYVLNKIQKGCKHN